MGSWGGKDSRCPGMAGPRLAECGTNRAGSLTTGRPCDPTFAQINQEGRTQSGGEWGRQSAGSTPPAAPHSRTDKPGRMAGREADRATQGSSAGKWSLKPLTENARWGWGSRRDSQPHRRGHWRDPQGPRACTSPPTREPAPEGPSLIVGSRVKD